MSSNFIKKTGEKIYQNRSLLLAVGSVAGLYASVIFAAKGQKKADEIIAERNDACNNPFDTTVMLPSKREIFDLTWPCYVPTVFLTLATTGCIIGSYYLDRRQIAALTGTVAILTANRGKIEEAVKEKYGEEGLNAIKQKLISGSEKEVEIIQTVAEETGKGDLLCFEGYSGRWFRSSEEAVIDAEKEFSKRFKEGNYICLNDFYELLGIEITHFGHTFGYVPDEWYYDHEGGIEFANTIIPADKTDRGEAVLYIDLFTYPMEGWYEL